VREIDVVRDIGARERSAVCVRSTLVREIGSARVIGDVRETGIVREIGAVRKVGVCA
jgi:hypothetical protein